jgi:DNA-binding MarR family transcriptional regulator
MTTIERARTVSASVSTIDADARTLSERVGELIRVVQFRDRDRACCYGISVSQCYALKAVNDAGGLTVNELAGELFLDKSTASRVANGLVDRGLLARTRDPEDKRVVRLVATEPGTALHARIEEDLVVEYAQLLSDLDPNVRSAVSEVVGRLTRSFASRVDASGGSCCVVS